MRSAPRAANGCNQVGVAGTPAARFQRVGSVGGSVTNCCGASRHCCRLPSPLDEASPGAQGPRGLSNEVQYGAEL